ncbi:hypothetical protein [Antrihabitans cavernicola]|uniref:Uncharacterized protein n=1 Tax=Antrihabitans cavernicola TaxID=2495913 RepID=A0A5A7SBP9_9NOCA|nr:hypothetical protein [Spelaeibacter cavernicola]KAA0022749.1 hypothetical protein FOY51_13820 [Spelaeibacter cavernicola]
MITIHRRATRLFTEFAVVATLAAIPLAAPVAAIASAADAQSVAYDSPDTDDAMQCDFGMHQGNQCEQESHIHKFRVQRQSDRHTTYERPASTGTGRFA